MWSKYLWMCPMLIAEVSTHKPSTPEALAATYSLGTLVGTQQKLPSHFISLPNKLWLTTSPLNFY